MKSFTNIFIYVYAAAITIMSFVTINSLADTNQENKELKSALQQSQKVLDYERKRCEEIFDLEEDRYQRYEMEVAYWGQLYEAMKAKHPKTAEQLEKQHFIPIEY